MFTTASPRLAAFALVAAVALTGLQGAAFAAEAMVPNGRTLAVSTTGLDLADAGHVATLDRRIADAARRVCAVADHRDLSAVAAQARCRETAIAAAGARRDTLIAAATGRERLASRTPSAGVD